MATTYLTMMFFGFMVGFLYEVLTKYVYDAEPVRAGAIGALVAFVFTTIFL